MRRKLSCIMKFLYISRDKSYDHRHHLFLCREERRIPVDVVVVELHSHSSAAGNKRENKTWNPIILLLS